MLNNFIQLIDEPNRSACIAMYNDHKERFDAAPGSLTKHQAWTGGYIHHLEETMDIGAGLYKMMDNFRQLDFTLSDVMLILFLHDLEKPFRYVEPKQEFHFEEEKKKFIDSMVHKYGIVLTDNHKNALTYIHGEGNEHNPTERIQKPLAAFVHICDVASARIWFDFPKRV